MKKTYVASVAIALTTLIAGQAMAANTQPEGKTRAQVRAELLEAQRTGDILADRNYGDETTPAGRTKLNELFPAQYPAKPAGASKTRAEVRAELAEAQRTGDMVASSHIGDDSGSSAGRKLNELFPSQYPAQPAVAGKTRAQVRAELAEAQRNAPSVDLTQVW